MTLSKDQLTRVGAAIEAIRQATGTTLGMTSNETVRDGSSVYLESSEGWFLTICGDLLKDGYEYPKLGLRLAGFVFNEKTDQLEAMTLYHGHANATTLDVSLDDTAGLASIVDTLVPAIRAFAIRRYAAWDKEKALAAETAQLQTEFGMQGLQTKFMQGPHPVELLICFQPPSWDSMGLSMRLEGLSADQVRAILKVLEPSPALAT